MKITDIPAKSLVRVNFIVPTSPSAMRKAFWASLAELSASKAWSLAAASSFRRSSFLRCRASLSLRMNSVSLPKIRSWSV